MSVIFAMCLFSLSMSISPGPVNLITLSTGVNYGFRSTMPFVSGASIGFTLLLLVIGLGVGSIVKQVPVLLNLLGYCGAAFIGYMGYKAAISIPQIQIQESDKPGFYQGFLLQWLNPKAWIACVSGVSAFNLADSLLDLLLFVGLYFMICYASIASWALAGDKIKTLLSQPAYLRVFNLVMGGALILVALYLVFLQYFNTGAW